MEREDASQLLRHPCQGTDAVGDDRAPTIHRDNAGHRLVSWMCRASQCQRRASPGGGHRLQSPGPQGSGLPLPTFTLC